MSGGRAGTPSGPGAFVRAAGVKEQGIATQGFPRNLGRSVDLLCIPGRGYRVTNPRPTVDSLGDVGSESRVLQRYHQAKATQRGGKGPRKSHRLVVPLKQGNLNRGDPGDGKGGAASENRGGETRPGLRPRVSSHRNLPG